MFDKMEPRYPAVGALTSCLCGGGAASHLRGGRIYQFTCQQRRNATGASLTLAASDTHRRLRTLARPLADPSFPSSLLDHFPNIESIAVIGPAPDSDIDPSPLSILLSSRHRARQISDWRGKSFQFTQRLLCPV
jgi:hypothetical protein